MKIVTIVRTRNEERNIANFCQGHAFSDLILIADGGSEDKTISIASGFPNVIVRNYPVKLFRNDTWANPEDEHYNFLIDWAMNEHPDWIIFEDCDCRPNKLLRENARELLETTECPLAFAVVLFMWGTDNLRGNPADVMHFPKLAKPTGGGWVPGLWAARPEIGIRPRKGDPWEHFRGFDIPDVPRLNIMPPYCRLHFPWPSEEEVQRKLTFYNKTNRVPNMLHPLKFGGPLELCPEWTIE